MKLYQVADLIADAIEVYGEDVDVATRKGLDSDISSLMYNIQEQKLYLTLP